MNRESQAKPDVSPGSEPAAMGAVQMQDARRVPDAGVLAQYVEDGIRGQCGRSKTIALRTVAGGPASPHSHGETGCLSA